MKSPPKRERPLIFTSPYYHCCHYITLFALPYTIGLSKRPPRCMLTGNGLALFFTGGVGDFQYSEHEAIFLESSRVTD